MNHEIFLRCHTCILDQEPLEKTGTKKAQPLPKYVLVLDTETTTDALQSLNFGVYQFCGLVAGGSYTCREEGAFYALSARKRQTPRVYSIRCWTLGCLVLQLFLALQFLILIQPPSFPVGMWEIPRLLRDFPSAGGTVGKSRVWTFPPFPRRGISTGNPLRCEA
jgi:hypothetical protein